MKRSDAVDDGGGGGGPPGGDGRQCGVCARVVKDNIQRERVVCAVRLVK